MSKRPPVEQGTYAWESPRDRLRSAEPHLPDGKTGVQSPDPGDTDVDLEKEGRYGDVRQNLMPQRSAQDR